MPLTSQDFQDVKIGLQDLLKAVQENTEAMRRSPGGGGGSLGSAPTGVGAGGAAPGVTPKKSKGFALSSLGKVMTAASPAVGVLGGLGAAVSAANPVGMAAAATGLVAQGVARSMQASMDFQTGTQGARVDAYASSMAHNETRDQATYRASMAREDAADRIMMDRANKEASEAWTESTRDYQLRRAEGHARTLGVREREEHRVLDPQMRARQRADQIMSNAMRYGALDSQAGRDNYERVYRNMKVFEERAERAHDRATEIIQRVNASRNGAQGSAHKAGP